MKKYYCYIILFIIPFISASAQDFAIKSQRTYSATGGEGSLPVIYFSEVGKDDLIIEFDIEGNIQPNLVIKFMFCDRYWNPYESYFLRNEGYNTSLNLWMESLPASVHGADFHYKGSFPNEQVTFPFAGKWMYYIIDLYENDICGYGKFYVVKPDVNLRGEISKDRISGEGLSGIFERTNRVGVEFNLNDEFFPSQVEMVEIVENNMMDYPYYINREEYNGYRYYEWDASRHFKFVARDIFPGNEYRTTDFRNAKRFLYPGFKAQINGVEIPRTYSYEPGDNNGRSILSDYKNDDSEYLTVKFSIRPGVKMFNNIYITGSFNNWDILPEYRLTESNGIYEIDLELKRGRYDYLYVTGYENENYVTNINWNELEGNFWETKTNYHVFLIYNTTDFGGYDEIIGYKKISSGVK